MAKSDIFYGRYVPRRNKKLASILDSIQKDNEKRIQPQPQAGTRQAVIDAYKKRENKEDAYKIAESINSRLEKEAFNKDIIDQWIEEYKATIQSKDEDAR